MKARRIAALVMCLLLVLTSFDFITAKADFGGWPRSYSSSGCKVTPTNASGQHQFVLTDNCTYPTCTREGKAVYQCSICGKTETKTAPKQDHLWVGYWAPETPATCTKAATESQYCDNCNTKKYREVGKPLGHDWGSWEVKQKATCTEEGLRWTDCNRCGWEKTEPIPALGHDWGEWYIAIPATELTEGWYRRDCKRGDIYQLSPYKLNGQPGDGIIEVDSGTASVMLWLSAVAGPFDTQNMTVSIGWVLTNIGNKDAKDYRVDVYDYANGVKGDVLSSARVFDKLNAGKTAKDVLIANYTEEEFKQGYKEVLVSAWATSDERTVYSNEVPLTIYFGDGPAPEEAPALHIEGSWEDIGENEFKIKADLENTGSCDITEWTIYIYHIEEDGDGSDVTEFNGIVYLKPGDHSTDAFRNVTTPTEAEFAQGFMQYGVFAIGYTASGTYVESNDVTVTVPLTPTSPAAAPEISVDAWIEGYYADQKKLTISYDVNNECDMDLELLYVEVYDSDGNLRLYIPYDNGTIIPANDFLSSNHELDVIDVVVLDEEIDAKYAEFTVTACCAAANGDEAEGQDTVDFEFDEEQKGNESELTLSAWFDHYDPAAKEIHLGASLTNNGDEELRLDYLWNYDGSFVRFETCLYNVPVYLKPGETYYENDIVVKAKEDEIANGGTVLTHMANAFAGDDIDRNVEANEVIVTVELPGAKQAADLDLGAITLKTDGNKLYMHAYVQCGAANENAADLHDWFISVFNEDDSENIRWYADTQCSPFRAGTGYTSDYAFGEDMYANASEADIAAGHKTVTVQAFAYTYENELIASNIVELNFELQADEEEKEYDLVLAATKEPVVGNRLYMYASVMNGVFKQGAENLYDWGITVYNEDDSVNMTYYANTLCNPFVVNSGFTSDYAFDEDMYAAASGADFAAGSKTVKLQAFGYTEDGEAVYSNIVELTYEFEEDTAIIDFELAAFKDSVVGSQLFMFASVNNKKESVDLYDWGIDVYNENGSLNMTFAAKDMARYLVANSGFSSDYAFGEDMYAIASEPDFNAGYKKVTLRAYAFTEDGVKVFSNTVELEYKLETEKTPEPVPETVYSLVLTVEKIDEKPLYGEETVEYRYTLTNTGTGDVEDIDIVGWVSDGETWFGKVAAVPYLPAGASTSGKAKSDLSFNIADESGVVTFRYRFEGVSASDIPEAVSSETCALSYETMYPQLSYQLDDMIWIPPVDTESEIVLAKDVMSFPANGEYYAEGESIHYLITATNIGDAEAVDIEIFDLLAGGNEDARIGYFVSMAPSETASAEYYHEVTAEEAQAGSLLNTAAALWTDSVSGEQKQASAERVVKTGVFVPENVSVLKQVKSGTGPKNGIYYEPGETIHYTVTIYNCNTWDICDITVDDSLKGNVYSGSVVIPAGYSMTVSYDYKVTQEDAEIIGSVTNTATVYYRAKGATADTRGSFNCIESNTVTVPASYTRPEPHLSIWMYETSTPKLEQNGCYRENDIITYDILVVNDGSEDLYGITVDILRKPADGSSQTVTLLTLPKNDYVFMSTDTKVTKDDVENAGYVLNMAQAYTYLEDATLIGAISNAVISPVDGVTFEKVKKEVKPDYCERTLVSVANGSEEYDQYYCADHFNAMNGYYRAVEAAADPAAKQAAWDAVRAAWVTEIDEMYAEMMAAAQPTEIAKIVSEKLLFYAYINGSKNMYEKLYDADTAAAKLCAVLADKCAEMCYELNAPEGIRSDSYLGSYSVKGSTSENADCSGLPVSFRAASTRYTVKLCAEHAEIVKNARLNALGLATAEERAVSFGSVQRRWVTMLNGCVSELYKTADAETRSAITAYRNNYGSYFDARAALLAIVYKDAPATAAEVLMREMMLEVAGICD